MARGRRAAQSTEKQESGFPAAGTYKVLISLSPRGYVNVAVVHRLWNGRDVIDRRTDLRNYVLDPGDPAGATREGLYALALNLLSRP